MKRFILAVVVVCLVIVVTAPAVTQGISGIQPPAGATDSSIGQPIDGCSNLKGPGGLKNVVNCVIDIFGYVMTILIAASVVLVVYGAFQMILSEEKRAVGKQTVMYGVIGLFIMISVWGLVTILDKTFNLSTATPINPPKLINN